MNFIYPRGFIIPRIAENPQSKGCKFGLYVSKQKKIGDQWALGMPGC
jgi:hypothetical protein